MRRRQQAGIGLMEMLVAVALMMGLLTVAYDLLVPILQMWTTNRAQADMEQSGLIVQTRLVAELQASDSGSVTTLSSPPALSFMSFGTAPGGYNPSTGQPLWQCYVIYYLDAPNRILYRKQWPQPTGVPKPTLPLVLPTSTAQALTSGQLQAVVNTENGTEARAAVDVASLTATTASSPVINLGLGLAVNTVGGLHTSDHQISVTLRN